MSKPDAPYIGVTCDCGHDHDVSVRGIDLNELVIICPSCGIEEKLTSEQIEDIVARNEAMMEEAIKFSDKLIDDILNKK